MYKRQHCLSEETVFNNDYSVIQELILDKEKIKYVPPVFEVAEVEKDYLCLLYTSKVPLAAGQSCFGWYRALNIMFM